MCKTNEKRPFIKATTLLLMFLFSLPILAQKVVTGSVVDVMVIL